MKVKLITDKMGKQNTNIGMVCYKRRVETKRSFAFLQVDGVNEV